MDSPQLGYGVAIRNVEGISPGMYRYDAESHSLVLLRPGHIAEELAAASKNQAFVGQAAVCLIALADIYATVSSGGPRAYIDTYIAAGLAGQRLYLASTALGIGCCAVGIFHDDEMEMLAGLEGSTQGVLSLFPIGVPRKMECSSS